MRRLLQTSSRSFRAKGAAFVVFRCLLSVLTVRRTGINANFQTVDGIAHLLTQKRCG